MDSDQSNISPTESGGQSKGKASLPQLKLQQNNSFSSYKSINLGQSNSPISKDEEHEYILGECKKLIMKGKYTKAFINIRRYLMDQDLNKSILPEFYLQVVHCCQKIIEKYFTKSVGKIMSKVPPLMSLCYQYLNQWETYLVNLQGDQECQNLIFGKSASIQEQVLIKKKSMAQKQQQWQERSPTSTKYKQSRFVQDDSSKKTKTFNESDPNSNRKNEDQEQSPNYEDTLKIEIGSFQFEQSDNIVNQQDEYIENEGDKYDALLLIKDKFHLFREQMLAYYLKTLYLSYKFHRIINQPMRSLKFLVKGSNIVRNFLDQLLFISSAELTRIASQKLKYVTLFYSFG